MTEQEINIVIAETCGWKLKSNGLSPMWAWKNESLTHRIKWVANKEIASQEVLPDYFNDLNAMREAERLLDEDLWLEYMLNLQDVLQRDPHRGKWIVCQDNMHSTAAQRAKAFVKTISKLKE